MNVKRILLYGISMLMVGVSWGGNMGVNFHASFGDIIAQRYRLTILACEGYPLLSEITFVCY